MCSFWVVKYPELGWILVEEFYKEGTEEKEIGLPVLGMSVDVFCKEENEERDRGLPVCSRAIWMVLLFHQGIASPTTMQPCLMTSYNMSVASHQEKQGQTMQQDVLRQWECVRSGVLPLCCILGLLVRGFVRFHVQHERDENRLWSSSPDGLRDNSEPIKRVSRILLGLVVDRRTNSFKCKRISTDKELEGERMMCGPAHKINLNCLQ